MSDAGVAEKLDFQAEVSRLLEIVTHSLYSNRDIFLRELIANAADACERRRYLSVSDRSLAPAAGYGITLSVDESAGTLTVADNGVGMSRQELIDNLGTIAASGTARFAQQLKSQGASGAPSQIGQFGVGFYSAFMVAEEVTVETRRAGEADGWRWRSDGAAGFTLEHLAEPPAEPGTRVVLRLKEDARDYLKTETLERLVKTWCDHVAVPIRLASGGEEVLNRASALWTRPRNEIEPEQYEAFYRDVAHAFDKPWRTLHYRAEGAIEYTGLVFIPTERPFALFHPDRKSDLRLHVKRVFITDDCKALLPPWLRFVKGVVDSEDLPLNVSRELLQASPVLAKIRQGLVKRILADLGKAAEEDPEGYVRFWEAFGAVMKEGLYEDAQHRDALLPLLRLHSSGVEGWTRLADYVARMRPGQEAIYTVSGESAERLAQSPQLEGFRARDIEVLYLTDPVDEFWVPSIGSFEGKPFRSVTRGQADLERFQPADAPTPADPEELQGLLARLRAVLGEAVKDVRASVRLADSPCCLVAAEGDLDLNLERLLKAHGQLDKASRRILEVNPSHPLIRALAKSVGEEGDAAAVDDVAWLLLDQARILEGEPVADPTAFARRLSGALRRGLEE